MDNFNLSSKSAQPKGDSPNPTNLAVIPRDKFEAALQSLRNATAVVDVLATLSGSDGLDSLDEGSASSSLFLALDNLREAYTALQAEVNHA
jgi:hypothetical protein